MATTRTQPTQPVSSTQLCDLCHQKPKFGGHQYCSKTCAGQAASLCKHCHKKPKFQNFDYCGKHCASLANANTGGGKPRGATAANIPKKGGTANTNNNNNGTNNNQQPTIDPVQIAQLVAKHVPQLQSLLASAQGQGSGSASTAAQPNNSLPNGSSQAVPSTNGTRSVPFFSRGKKKAQPQLNVSTKQTTDDTGCIIPGCKQSGYVDEEGVVSDFCSLRHREEAVTSGLMSPCIMCLVLPQSDVDYFCSKACREESLNKQFDDDGEEWSPAESQN